MIGTNHSCHICRAVFFSALPCIGRFIPQPNLRRLSAWLGFFQPVSTLTPRAYSTVSSVG
ncbi:protein of unknown function [Paraburkholderia dioscoreae]|uniref:Uncharacterized protein n=1 Tax=Paraburkholderia dioscoreae TaxID=2604047 RepID=A0A5Q4ZKT7_9BURK|nr:protein of unknown function [Paraburkholderia dioscoreae]